MVKIFFLQDNSSALLAPWRARFKPWVQLLCSLWIQLFGQPPLHEVMKSRWKARAAKNWSLSNTITAGVLYSQGAAEVEHSFNFHWSQKGTRMSKISFVFLASMICPPPQKKTKNKKRFRVLWNLVWVTAFCFLLQTAQWCPPCDDQALFRDGGGYICELYVRTLVFFCAVLGSTAFATLLVVCLVKKPGQFLRKPPQNRYR